jgi:hypothetical protein
MAMKSRTSAADKSNQAPSFKSVATFTDYVDTVKSAYKKWEKAQPKSKDGKAMPEAGQFYGALLQNRKYDSKGKLVK